MVRKTNLTNLSERLMSSYQACQNIARSHYENFPVASFLLPVHLRRPIAAIYAFARTADDIADEGSICRDTRLEMMTRFESNLYDLQYGKPPTEAIFIALEHTIESFNLPIQLFYDLLTAFRQDILKDRYQNFTEVKDYCHYSANPVGRLLLHITGQSSPENLLLSDSICTGLQLINFIQDVQIDLNHKNRCYIPLEELEEFEINLSDIRQGFISENYQALIAKQLLRATEIYQHGLSLGQILPGFFGLEIRFIIACGQKLIEKLHTRQTAYDRPIMRKYDMFLILCKLLLVKRPAYFSSEPVLDKS